MNVFKSKLFIIIAACVTLAAVIVASVCIVMRPDDNSDKVPTTAEKIPIEKEPVTQAPAAVMGGYLTAGVDFDPDSDYKTQIDGLLTSVYERGGNCVCVNVGLDSDKEILKYIVEAAHKKALVVYAALSPLESGEGQYDTAKEDNIDKITSRISNLCAESEIDGVILTDLKPSQSNPPYESYLKSGDSVGYDAYREQSLYTFVRRICSAVRKAGHGVCIGVQTPCNDSEMSVDWATRGVVDFIIVTDLPDTAHEEGGYQTAVDQWIAAVGGKKPLYFALSSTRALAGQVSESVLIAQTEYLVSKGNNGFVTDSLAALGELDDLSVCLASINDESFGIRNLSVTTPSSRNYTTYSESISFIGASDPMYPLLLNGQELKRTDTGYFSIDQKLSVGENTFTFEHKGSKQTYKIEYKDIIIRSIFPDKEHFCDGNVEITVSAVAKNGSTLWARLGSEVKEMSASGGATNDRADAFATYTATFVTPPAQDVPVEIGELIITASNGAKNETKAGGRLVVRTERVNSDPITSTSPDEVYESGYGIIVGEGDRYVAEVAIKQTETLDIISPIDERSRPTNAYLPQGTVDYCSNTDAVFFNPESGNTNKFRNLDYGKRVYSDNNIKIFKAILPETNTITAVDCTDNGRHTVITFDTAWKAPFNVTLAPQSYNDPYRKGSRPDYSIDETTYEYLDIEFCYTQSGQGRVELEGNPIFKSAEWIKSEKGYYTLRLWLREKGKFYGWMAEYNDQNQLQFYFLDPVQIKEAPNSYGYSLEGVKIVVDAGHGGPYSPGAVGSSKQYTEAVLNLILSRKIQRELENLGATVIMTRTDDSTLSLEDRNKITNEEKPDLFISIHRNSSESSSIRGYEDFYFHPFSKALAEAVYNQSIKDFTVGRKVQYYPFYVTRVSCCPSILTENGFMSNSADLEMIKTDAHNEKLAVSITQGIVDYLASIKMN